MLWETFWKGWVISIHHRIIQVLVAKMYEIKSDFSPKTFSWFFYLSKHLNGLFSQIMNEVFRVNPSVPTLWGIRKIYIVEDANQWVMGPRQSCFSTIKFDQ